MIDYRFCTYIIVEIVILDIRPKWLANLQMIVASDKGLQQLAVHNQFGP
jgi:hypothetical protein